MATATVPQQQSAVIPSSFTEALENGWTVLSEVSKEARGKRCGSVVLAKDGRRVSVFFFANADGYHFGTIKLVRPCPAT
jgi:hypothetical protein